MSLADQVREDVKAALRAGDKARLGTLRMLLAGIKQREVDERIQLDDSQIVTVLQKMIRQRQEAMAQFEAGGRADLAAKERAEIQVLEPYLPRPLTEAELAALIDAAIAAVGATGIRDMGKVMAEIRTRAQGRADMGALGGRVKDLLSR